MMAAPERVLLRSCWGSAMGSAFSTSVRGTVHNAQSGNMQLRSGQQQALLGKTQRTSQPCIRLSTKSKTANARGGQAVAAPLPSPSIVQKSRASARRPARAHAATAPQHHQLRVVGDLKEFGRWTPSEGVELEHVGGNLWTAQCVMPADLEGTTEFKVVDSCIGKPDAWDKGSNRKLQLPLPPAPSSQGQWHLLLHHGMPSCSQLVFEQPMTCGQADDEQQSVPPSLMTRCVLQVRGAQLDANDELFMVGSSPQLGGWQVKNGLPLKRVGNHYEATLEAPAAMTAEYKLVRKDAEGNLHWEQDPNRRLVVYDPTHTPTISAHATRAVSYITIMYEKHVAAPPPVFLAVPSATASKTPSPSRRVSPKQATVMPSLNGAPANSVAANGVQATAALAHMAPKIILDAPAANGVPVNGVAVNGVPVHGVPVNGVPVNGVPANGVPANGVVANGVPQKGAPAEVLQRLLSTLLHSVSGQASQSQLLDAVHDAAAQDKVQAASTLAQLKRQLQLVEAELGGAPASNGAAGQDAYEPEARLYQPQQQHIPRSKLASPPRKHSPSPLRPIGPPPSDTGAYESKVMGMLAMFPSKTVNQLQDMLTSSDIEPRYTGTIEQLSSLLNYLVAQGTITADSGGQYKLRDVNVEVAQTRRRSPSPRQRPRDAVSDGGFDMKSLADAAEAHLAAAGLPTPSPAPSPKPRGRAKAAVGAAADSVAVGATKTGAKRGRKPKAESEVPPSPDLEANGSHKPKQRTWSTRSVTKSPNSVLQDAADADAREVVPAMPGAMGGLGEEVGQVVGEPVKATRARSKKSSAVQEEEPKSEKNEKSEGFWSPFGG